MNEAAKAANALREVYQGHVLGSSVVTERKVLCAPITPDGAGRLQCRNYAPITIKQYLRIIDDFAGYFGKPIEKLGPNHIRSYQAHLFRDRKLASRTVRQHVAALRFVFVKTLKRAYMLDYIPFPKEERRLPVVLSQEVVTGLIEASNSLMYRAMLMTLYAAGLRRTEAANLKVADIDSESP